MTPTTSLNWIHAGAALCIALLISACSPSPLLPTSTGSTSAALVEQDATAPSGAFGAFVDGLWPAARARGVSRGTFDAAFAGVTFDPKVIELTQRQAEFVKPVWQYMATAVSDKRLDKGRALVAQWGPTLASVESTYGVDRSVIMGVWGMETNFGGTFGDHNVIQALATLAYARYRGDYFRSELLNALQILEEGHVAPAAMQGSWAGAMGHTQFMPSSFKRFAVDFDGDRHRDIWGSVPDALASTANYLKKNGWRHGLPWGFEVQMPAGTAGGAGKRSFGAWAAAGVRRVDGKPMPGAGEASLFQPAAGGPVFLVTANFAVIKRYNNSDKYALGVGHLGDRVYGGEPIQAAWPGAEVTASVR